MKSAHVNTYKYLREYIKMVSLSVNFHSYMFFGRKIRRTCPLEFYLYRFIKNGFYVKYLPIPKRKENYYLLFPYRTNSKLFSFYL